MNPVVNAATEGNEQEGDNNKVRHEIQENLKKGLDKELNKVLRQ